MAGAIQTLDEWERQNDIAPGQLSGWVRHAVSLTGNPVDPDYLSKGKVASSFGACLAVIAARQQDRGRADRYLRRLMEYFQVRGLPADTRVLTQAARDVGLDADRIRREWGSPEVESTFSDSRSEMRRARVTLQDITYRSEGQPGVTVRAHFDRQAHEEAVERLAPGIERRPADSITEYVRRDGNLVSAREVEQVFALALPSAEGELEKLWRAGTLERWAYAGAVFWTGLRTGRR